MRYHLNAPARHTIRMCLLHYQAQLKAAKRESKKAFLSVTEAESMLEATSAGLELIPAVLSDDHDGHFELDTSVVFVSRCGLLLLGADLIKRREALAERRVKTGDVQDKIDEVVRLQAALGEQRDLYEFVGMSEASVQDVAEMLAELLPTEEQPTLADLMEWPFSWRLEVHRWAAACLAHRDAAEGAVLPDIPPRPSILDRPSERTLWDTAEIEATPALADE